MSSSMKPPQKLTFVHLGVNDLKASTEFYHEGLGWSLDERHTFEQATFIRLGSVRLVLFSKTELAKDAGGTLSAGNDTELNVAAAQKLPFSGMTLTNSVNSEEEVHQVLEAAREAGALVGQASKKPWGYTGYFRDLDGHYWEVAYAPDYDE